MSVYQVEEYYVYVAVVGGLTKSGMVEVENFIKLKFHDSFEVTPNSVLVEDFDVERDAEDFECELLKFLGGNK